MDNGRFKTRAASCIVDVNSRILLSEILLNHLRHWAYDIS